MENKMTLEELSTKNESELQLFAQENNIDLYGCNTKIEILEVLASFFGEKPKPKLKKQKDAVDRYAKEQQPVKEELTIDKVALYSQKNIHWNGVGALKVGYNIVKKEVADKWLTRKTVREVTPQELASYYGK